MCINQSGIDTDFFLGREMFLVHVNCMCQGQIYVDVFDKHTKGEGVGGGYATCVEKNYYCDAIQQQ